MARMSKAISDARTKRSVTLTAVKEPSRTAKTSPASVATWICSNGSSAPAAESSYVAASPHSPSSPLAARVVPESRIAPPRISGESSIKRSRDWAAVSRSDISSKILGVSLERASWLTVVAICVIAVLLLGLGGYTGYSITVGAVGIAAAVNLLPSP